MNMRGQQRFWSWWLLPLLGAGMVIDLGCDDMRRHQTSAAAAFVAPSPQGPTSQPADPDQVVKAFLNALRDAHAAGQSGVRSTDGKARYQAAMSKVAGFAARRAIYEDMIQVKSATLPVGLSEDAALTVLTESWVSMAAYYVDGFLWDTLDVRATTEGLGSARIEAEHPEDRRRLDQIEDSAEFKAAGDDSGRPLVAGTDAYLKFVRQRALAMKPSFNVPIRAEFHVTLRRGDEGWRVSRMDLGLARRQVRGPVPQPTATSPTPTTEATPDSFGGSSPEPPAGTVGTPGITNGPETSQTPRDGDSVAPPTAR